MRLLLTRLYPVGFLGLLFVGASCSSYPELTPQVVAQRNDSFGKGQVPPQNLWIETEYDWYCTGYDRACSDLEQALPCSVERNPPAMTGAYDSMFYKHGYITGWNENRASYGSHVPPAEAPAVVQVPVQTPVPTTAPLPQQPAAPQPTAKLKAEDEPKPKPIAAPKRSSRSKPKPPAEKETKPVPGKPEEPQKKSTPGLIVPRRF